MKKIRIKVETNTGNYPIIIGTNLSNNLSKILKDNSIYFNKGFLLIDNNLNQKIIKKLTSSLKQKKIIYKFSPSERNKNINKKLFLMSVY